MFNSSTSLLWLLINSIQKGKRNIIPFIDHEDYSNETPFESVTGHEVIKMKPHGCRGMHCTDTPADGFLCKKPCGLLLIYCNCRPDMSAKLKMWTSFIWTALTVYCIFWQIPLNYKRSKSVKNSSLQYHICLLEQKCEVAITVY